MTEQTSDLLNITADIVAAMVSNNTVAAGDVPELISNVYAALAGLGEPEPVAEPEYVGAVSIKKSLSDPDKIVSMIDGKGYSGLSRHLTAHGLTMDEYRERYNLPASYPSVAPGYSAKRRELAVSLGLGRKKSIEAAPASVPAKKIRKPRQSAVERLRDAKARGPFGQAEG